MPLYLAELYRASGEGGDLAEAAVRARAAADALARTGTRVRYVRSVFVPADETWFLLYDAPSVAAVEEAADRAELRLERIVEALEA
jgi:Nickel responsive protein SCO4226-like